MVHMMAITYQTTVRHSDDIEVVISTALDDCPQRRTRGHPQSE